MSPFRPDLVACWMFRVGGVGGPRILLLKRAPGRIFPGIWQPVTGRLEADETIVDGALRELREETGIDRGDLETLYGLDQVNIFHADHIDMLQAEAVFAAELRHGIEATLSEEHDEQRWVAPAEAAEMVVWPAYRSAIAQIEWLAWHRELASVMQVGSWATPESKEPRSMPAEPAKTG